MRQHLATSPRQLDGRLTQQAPGLCSAINDTVTAIRAPTCNSILVGRCYTSVSTALNVRKP